MALRLKILKEYLWISLGVVDYSWKTFAWTFEENNLSFRQYFSIHINIHSLNNLCNNFYNFQRTCLNTKNDFKRHCCSTQDQFQRRKKTFPPRSKPKDHRCFFLSFPIEPTNQPISLWNSPFSLATGIRHLTVISCCTWPSPRKSKIRPCTRAEAEGSQPRRISRGPCRSERGCIRRTWRRSRAPRAPLSVPCCTRDAPPARDRTTASKGSCNNTEGEKRSETYLEDEGAAAPVKRNRKRCRCRELREREGEREI